MDLKQKLAQVVKGEIQDQNLESYSKDASVFEVMPQIVVSPRDTQDIKNLVKFANQNAGYSLTARSAGTDMGGGPLSESIVLDMTKHFNQVLKVGETSAVTQPGVYYRDFEPETLARGLILPCYTASREICTVGGMVANNSAGEMTLSYGQTDKYVKRLKIVFSDGNEYEVKPLNKQELEQKIKQGDFEGNLYKQIFDLIEENKELISVEKPKTSKNSSGYYLWNVWDGEVFDLTKLIVGSQGTLGIITEIEFGLVKPKTNSALLVIELSNLNNLDKIINEVLKFGPESFECFDDLTIQYATKFLSEIASSFHHNSLLEVYWKFLPDIIKSWTGSLPKLTLLANFTGDDSALVKKTAETAAANLIQFDVQTKIFTDIKDAEKYWITRHESFNLLRHHAVHMRTAPIIDDIVVSPSLLPEFLPKLQLVLEKYKQNTPGKNLIYTIAGHIGDGNFHIIPLMDLSDPKMREIIPQFTEDIYNLVFEYKGSMTAEHNDGLIRGPFLEQMFGEDMYQLFKEVKEIFDPKGIFNPHKKVDATFKYSWDHLAKS